MPELRVRILGDEPTGEEEPAYFADLLLDQVVAAITAGRDEYRLEPFFWSPLRSEDAIAYRHEVFRDLERGEVAGPVRAFAEAMRAMRDRLARANALRYAYQKQRWFLDAVATYCRAVARLAADLDGLDVRSRGLVAVREHVARYVRSDGFAALRNDATAVDERLAEVGYSVRIRGNRVAVRRYEGEADYSREVLATFERFRQGAARDYRVTLRDQPDMDHVEAQVLHGVAELHEDVFAALTAFCERHRDFLDDTVGTFDREVQFYLACLEHIDRLGPGLPFCYPEVSADAKEVTALDTFDLALAGKLLASDRPVVTNDVTLNDPERILVVTGPNQGGKTTFARTFGQLHHLAAIGCPVPGNAARLCLFDALFTHFELPEDLSDRGGKLDADLRRLHAIVERATPRSVVILNESFASTTLDDAVFLGTRVLEELIDLDLLCVCVTFVDELSSLGDTVVSLVSAADRTYKIERRPADGLAYAAAIAQKYGLTYDALKARVAA